ncbi:MAG: hypothetical protein FJ257_08730 [Phycisphaerae bacterium]|nr:hypothetical protein [Phycisphaerae bacterium]
MSAAPSHPVAAAGGASARVLIAFDVGVGIDLDLAARRLAEASRAGLWHEGGTSRRTGTFEYEPLPLRLASPAGSISVGGLAVAGEVEVTLFDFGSMSVHYRLPIPRELKVLRAAMPVLAGSEVLVVEARRRVESILARLGDAVDRPSVAADAEDYVVLVMPPEADRPASVESFDPQELAQLLRAEQGELSEEEVRDSTAERVSHGRSDLAVVDWHGALVIDADPEPTVEVLEFANVQLLEFRHLDRQLDLALSQAYETLRGGRSLGGRGLGWRWSAASRDWRRLARLQVEAALLYESIQNALKLVGDQSLARLMAATARRFHLHRWEASILRKLEVLESIYSKFSDAQAHRRAEILEWIIIALIAFEVVFGLLPTLGR